MGSSPPLPSPTGYSYQHKYLTVELECAISKAPGENTQVMVTFNWAEHNIGISLGTLVTLVGEIANSLGLIEYQIFHDPKGIVIVGQP